MATTTSHFKNLFLCIFLFLSINHLSAQVWVNYDPNDGLIDGVISDIDKDADGNFWFSSWGNIGGTFTSGLSKFDGTDFTSISSADGLPSDTVFDVLVDSNNLLWVGTSAGVATYDGTTWTTINDNLVGNFVWSIFEDSDNNIWISSSIASAPYVLSKFDGTTWTTINDSRGYRDIQQSADGSIWTCDNEGVHKYEGTTWTTYNTSDGLSYNQVYTLFFDDDNNLWIGNYGDVGLDKFDGTTWTTYTTADGLAHNNVRAIFQNTNGDLWFGTNEGISVFNGTDWTSYDDSDGLIENHVRAFYQDNNGEIWIGTWEGVSKFTDPTSIDNIDLRKNISLYPNPTSSILNIKSEIFKVEKITIYDVIGRNVFREMVYHDFVNLSSLDKGIYLAELEDSDGIKYTYKIVKE